MPRQAATLRTEPEPTPLTLLTVKVTGSPRVTSLCGDILALEAEKATLIAKLDEKRQRLASEMKSRGARDKKGKLRLETSDFKMVLIEAENEYIGKDTLLAAGVKASIIAACIKKTPYAYPKVTAKKDATNGDD